jgi:toluene monooxygenase system ferredoxin subunit
VTFRPALRRQDLWIGQLVGVSVAGVPVLLVGLEDRVCAYEDSCTHQRVKLSEGTLEGNVLTCGAHGWCYDALTGAGINPSDTALKRFAVRVEDGDILVDVEERR